MSTVVFHVDVNSAFLSFEAVRRLQMGDEQDLREIPSAVGGDRESRRGIILAKSIPCKRYGIRTGEPIAEALRKCPHLVLVRGDYDLYMRCSRAMRELLERYTDRVRMSGIEEGFLEFDESVWDSVSPEALAETIRAQIKLELGFTVSVGVSNNRLLAKMASDLRKPDVVTTLYPEELAEKIWPLPVENLWMVGRATLAKLDRVGVRTIGDLARLDVRFLTRYLKSHGRMLWHYAHGIDEDSLRTAGGGPVKSIGNSRTLPFDVIERREAHMAVLSMTETVCWRLRAGGYLAGLVTVMYKTSAFEVREHQGKLCLPTDHTTEVFEHARRLFDECWNGAPVRSVGVRLSDLSENACSQISFFDSYSAAKNQHLDRSIDRMRARFGAESIQRACFIGSRIRPTASSLTREEKSPDGIPFMS